MKWVSLSLLVAFVVFAAGCTPDLVVKDAKINFTDKTVVVRVTNIGNGDAGRHLTHIEINQVDSPTSAKPEAQKDVDVLGIVRNGVWVSGPIPFSDFTTRPGIDLDTLTTANLVILVDSKNMVEESNEENNNYDEVH